MPIRLTLSGVAVLLAASALSAQQEESEKVYKKIVRSVVSIENLEGSGTGLLLDKKGLILTNAHVVVSPFPFEVRVETGKDDPATVTFKNVRVVGVHPRYDLALLQIDPDEQKVTLQPAKMAKSAGNPGQRVYAIGNPVAAGMTLAKTITSGMVSASDRVIEELPYYQFSAQVNPGNSGGPLCDKSGTVLGLVTFKVEGTEGIGFAIPLEKFKADVFVPLSERKSDPAKARELIDAAEEWNNRGQEYGRQFGLDDERRISCNMIAAVLYRQALTHDPANVDLYYNIGMLLRTAAEYGPAVAYLVRSITLNPWGIEDGKAYRELGLVMVYQKKLRESDLVFEEGIAKFPRRSGKIWEDVSISRSNEGRHLDAAYSARVGLVLGDARTEVLQKIYADSKAALSAEDRETLAAREQAIEATLGTMEKASAAAKKAGRAHVTKEFEKLIETLDLGVSPDAKATDEELWGDPDAKPDAPAEDDDAAVEKKIRGKISLAKSYVSLGKRTEAISVLETVIAEHPDHPKTEEARALLKTLKP